MNRNNLQIAIEKTRRSFHALRSDIELDHLKRLLKIQLIDSLYFTIDGNGKQSEEFKDGVKKLIVEILE